MYMATPQGCVSPKDGQLHLKIMYNLKKSINFVAVASPLL
jgi:hypothetical protein